MLITDIQGIKLIINRAKGIFIDHAFNGQLAYQFVEKYYVKEKMLYDLIFMDLSMPVMDGLDVTIYYLAANLYAYIHFFFSFHMFRQLYSLYSLLIIKNKYIFVLNIFFF